MRTFRPLLLGCSVLSGAVMASAAEPAVDPARDRVLYTVAYSHLDTQWRWSYEQTIREFIPNTVRENLPLFEKYPHYIFNFSGANRYRMMQEYYPEDFQKVRALAAAGRWFPCGSSWEESDVLIPSSESLLRQVLLGQRFFKREFGTESAEYMLPDCFGFPASLPSLLAHCGLRGFSTQKLSWGSAAGIPFNVGVWEGLDGESVIAAFNAGAYVADVKENLSSSAQWKARIEANGGKSGVFADYLYHGVGDVGGAPHESSVKWVEESLKTGGPVRVVAARADQMFLDVTDLQKARLPKYKGDLLLTEHSAGSLTSQAYMKRWNRMNELLADAAERASVAAHLLGAASYPREKLHRAWGLALGGQFHDILPGTSLPRCYELSWNDEVIAMNCFAEVLQDAAGAVARGLDTRVEGTPLVVYNPLSIDREDVVEAELALPTGAAGLQVADASGRLVPTQVLSINDGKARFLFRARVPSIGFAVYGARPAAASTRDFSLAVKERSLENSRYRVTLNDAGDISSIFDKLISRELLSAPARLAFLHERPQAWPAWNMDWTDREKPPIGYVDGPAQFRIVENGPVRVAVEITRSARGSRFVQTIRLAGGAAGDRIEVANAIDWQSQGCSLKAEFPLAVSNPQATYNWEIGKIQRANNDSKKFEVPSHQWFDLTDKDGSAGVSILTGAKYGSDKPADNTVRLTLLYTPGVRDSYKEQQTQDWGRHEFVYGISGHRGDWRQGGTDWQAARQEQPMLAFQAVAHPGQLGRSFSLLRVNSSQVAVRALKLAEDSDAVIVRLQELDGRSAADVAATSAARIDSALEVNGLERGLQSLRAKAKKLPLAFKPFQLRTLALNLKPVADLGQPRCVPVALPYNMDVFSTHTNRGDGKCDYDGRTIPGEMMGDSVVSEGVMFAMGPRSDGKLNAVSCEDQVIELPKGAFNRVYLLATSVQGDTRGAFVVDGVSTVLAIQDWSAPIGRWDNRVFAGGVPAMTYSIDNALERITPGFIKRAPIAWFSSHRHNAQGHDEPYTYTHLYKYRLDVPAGAKTLRLPRNSQIRILAVTAVQNENDATCAAQPLYDKFDGRAPIQLNVADK